MKRPHPLRLLAGILVGVAGFGGIFHVATSTRLGHWAFNRCTLRVVNASGAPIENVRWSWRPARGGSERCVEAGTVLPGETGEFTARSKGGLIVQEVEYTRAGQVRRKLCLETVKPGGAAEVRVE